MTTSDKYFFVDGRKLMQIRTALSMTQVQFAAAIGLSPTRISTIERSDATGIYLSTAARIESISGMKKEEFQAGKSSDSRDDSPSLDDLHKIGKAMKSAGWTVEAIIAMIQSRPPMRVAAHTDGEKKRK